MADCESLQHQAVWPLCRGWVGKLSILIWQGGQWPRPMSRSGASDAEAPSEAWCISPRSGRRGHAFWPWISHEREEQLKTIQMPSKGLGYARALSGTSSPRRRRRGTGPFGCEARVGETMKVRVLQQKNGKARRGV